MFALREIEKGSLYALAYGDDSDCFQECFENWQDPLYLHQFFKKHSGALEYYEMTSKEAAQYVIDESRLFYQALINASKTNKIKYNLDSLFQSLHKNEDKRLQYLETKAYGRKKSPSMLRMYAIRLEDGCYIVVGGLIKIEEKLNDFNAGKQMLRELKKFSKYLKDNKFENADDIVELVI